MEADNDLNVNGLDSSTSSSSDLPAKIILEFNEHIESFLKNIADKNQRDELQKASKAILSRLLDPSRDSVTFSNASDYFVDKQDLLHGVRWFPGNLEKTTPKIKSGKKIDKLDSNFEGKTLLHLTKSKLKTLSALANEKHPVSAKEIISTTSRSRSVESNYLNQLWKENFLEKTQDPDGSMLFSLNNVGKYVVKYLNLGSLRNFS